MKKNVIVCICFLLGLSFSVHAQQLRFGVKGALNISEIDDFNIMNVPEDDEGGDLGSKLGFYGGLAVQYLFDQNWGIESGFYYSQLGGEVERGLNPKCKVTANPSYLQLPIQAIYKFDVNNSGLKIYPAIGLYIGYGLNGKVKVKGETTGLFIPDSYDYFDEVKRFDLGVALGLNFEYKDFVLGGAYDMGLTKVGKNSLNDNARNSVMRVSLGYFF